MLQLKISQGWMMKYSSISWWIHPDIPLMLHSIKQFLAAGILQANGLPTHWTLGASLAPFKNALKMKLVLAISQR
jgi:hypothetical protein